MGVKAPTNPFRVIRAEDAEVSILSPNDSPINTVIKEVLVVDKSQIDALTSQLRSSEVKIEVLHKEAADLRSQISRGQRVVVSEVEKIIEVPTDRIIERDKFIEVKVLNQHLLYFAIVSSALAGALICYILR